MSMRVLHRVWLVGILAIAGCARHEEDAAVAKSGAHPRVRVVAIESRTFHGEIEANGQWKAATETVIQAPFDAIIERVEVRPGDVAQKGATLGWWQTYESEAAVRGA